MLYCYKFCYFVYVLFLKPLTQNCTQNVFVFEPGTEWVCFAVTEKPLEVVVPPCASRFAGEVPFYPEPRPLARGLDSRVF